MYSAAFIWEPGIYDAEFHRLNALIEEVARSLPGFLGVEFGVHLYARYRELRAALAPVVRQAERAGVRVAIEPLNRYETSLVNTVEQALEALGPLLGPGLGLALDAYHLNIEEKDIGAAVRSAGEHLAHVQVCGNDRGAVGDDHLDWPAFLDALDDVGYAGVLGLESFTGENATIAVAASVWRPLAPTQDELAERSIRYLTALQDERERR